MKTNIVEELEKTLRTKNWRKEPINIGSVRDSYHGIEFQYKIVPDILKLMVKYKTPVVISTKSDLILRACLVSPYKRLFGGFDLLLY